MAKGKEKITPKQENTFKVSVSFKNAIHSYLDSFAKENEFFANKYANEKKSIEDCCAYIIGEVQKMKVNGLSDDEVFYLARHYYEEEDLKVNPLPSGLQVVVNHHIELTEEEKAEMRKKALEEIKNEEKEKLLKEEKKKKEREEKAQLRAIEKEKKEAEKTGQLSLFDF